jgi:hypothetical protein
MGYLVFKSSLILGLLLIIGGLGWLTEFLTAVLLPNGGVKIVMFTSWGEVLFPLWLLVKGVNVEQWKKRAAESGCM